MVIDKKKHSDKARRNQGSSAHIAEPNKIGSSSHFDFEANKLTRYGGLFPVATVLGKLGNEILTVTRAEAVLLQSPGIHAGCRYTLTKRLPGLLAACSVQTFFFSRGKTPRPDGRKKARESAMVELAQKVIELLTRTEKPCLQSIQ
jgi:hypothetical protein